MGHQNVKKKLIYSETLHKTKSPKKDLTAQHLRRKFEGWGGGGGGCLCHIPPHHHPTPDTQMSQYHRHDLNVRGGVVVVEGL